MIGESLLNKKIKKSSTKKTGSLKSKLLAKLLLKPSMWLSCAQPNNQTLHQSTFYFAPSSSSGAATTATSSSSSVVPIYASMIETNMNSANALQLDKNHRHQSERSHDELVMKSTSATTASLILHSARAGDTGYETLSTRYDADFIPPASTLFQVNIRIFVYEIN